MRIVIDLQACQTAGSKNRGIGRYSVALAQAMVKNGGKHEFWLALNGSYLNTIEPIRAAFDGLIPQDHIRTFEVVAPVADINAENTWRRQVSEYMREAFIADLQPDFVHVSSLFEGLVEDAVTSIGHIDQTSLHAVTLYDLIPLLNPKPYLENAAVRDWYYRKLQFAKRSDLLLAISESSRQEGIHALQLPPERVFNISTAIDSSFRPLVLGDTAKASLRLRYGLKERFLMYTGGIDYRKNIEGLITAYAMLPAELRHDHQLAIVCSIQQADRDRLSALCSSQGLANDEVVFTGYVPEEDLLGLYNLCTLFVFPSQHEGFGLPALEAMACGAATIGANNSSIPEVIGRNDALFDARAPRHIAAKIAAVLQDEAFRTTLREHGLKQASKFSWDASAKTALEAMGVVAERRDTVRTVAAAGASRARLAYVSPMPPSKTGIADYSAELLPELTRHYDIEVIVDQPEVSDPWVCSNLAIHDYDWFDKNAKHFDRIVYNFGNSHFHERMFGLLERHPGTVVLHDFYLSHLQQWRQHHHQWPGHFPRSLLDSHGYSALIEHIEDRNDGVVWRYPANFDVLAHASGVIVHSQFALTAAARFYGNAVNEKMEHLHQLRAIPQVDRHSARVQLGLDDDEFVVCSFGMLGPIKLNERLLTAFLSSSLAKDPKCRLVFVGSNDMGAYGKEIERRIREESGCEDRVIITGFLPADIFNAYLCGSDVAVQLRTQTRGETSRAVLDCMAHGLPVILNAHGTMAEFPSDAVIKIADEFEDHELALALERLRKEKTTGERLRARALAFVREHHAPANVGQRFYTAIEKFARHGSKAREQRLVEAIGNLRGTAISDDDLCTIARDLNVNSPPLRQRELLIDISVLVQVDAKSGIQRVVRSILNQLLREPPAGYRVEPIYSVQEGGWLGYRYARQYTLTMLGHTDPSVTDDVVEPRCGDTFLGLDLTLHRASRLVDIGLYSRWRARGVGIHFVVYDLLPLLHSRHFELGVTEAFDSWVDAITAVSDGLICISRTVSEELHEWLHLSQVKRDRPLGIGWFHLGADVEASIPTKGMPEDAPDILANLAKRPTILMVGTLEPRKGQALALAAFERLWEKGIQANLAIVGKQGWLVEELAIQLKNHPEHNRRLFWLHNVSDEYLQAIYANSSALLAASEAEGFGLPLIEAAQFGIPIIARDIPVFREVGGEHAFYFSGNSPAELSTRLTAWLKKHESGEVPQSKNMPWQTWAESARQLMNVVSNHRWTLEWMPDGAFRYRGSSPSLRSHVGKREGGLIKTTGQTGYLIFGPFLPLRSGQYQVRVWGKTKVVGHAKLDVCIDTGTNILAESILTTQIKSNEPVELISSVVISLDKGCQDLEVRLWVSDDSEIELSRVEISVFFERKI